MRARINIDTDPISLVVIAADGVEHNTLDAMNGKIVEVALIIKAKPDFKSDKKV